MGTPFTEIYDLFLVMVQDYKIDILYDVSEITLNNYLKGFLTYAITAFSQYCTQDLGTADFDLGYFTITLTLENKVMLAKEMQNPWMERIANKVLDMEMQLSDTDFKRYSEAQNLTAKNARLQMIREKISQDELDYFMLYNRSRDDWESTGFFLQ